MYFFNAWPPSICYQSCQALGIYARKAVLNKTCHIICSSIFYIQNRNVCSVLFFQELANFFTELVAEIFGYGEYAGWRLSSLDGKSHSDDILFKRVYNFLHPYGSIFKLIDKLESENAVFDIPPTLLQVCAWCVISKKIQVRGKKGLR